MKLEAWSLAGKTRMLDSSRASAISPKMRRATNAGNGKMVGRCKTLPKVLVNSRLVTGDGETALIGPDKVGVSMA